MTHRILIADCSKPSLVMTSEIFKDRLPGCVVLVASSGAEVLSHLEPNPPDMVVIDFDLPDADGASLIAAVRETFRGPILMTAHPDPVVQRAVADLLFAYNDCGTVIPKPVRADTLIPKIDQFLTDRHRLGRRFGTSLEATVIGKSDGPGKRTPKVHGRIINCSIGGACLELDLPIRVKGVEEVTLSLTPPTQDDTALSAGDTKVQGPPQAKIRATIQWLSPNGKTCGVRFAPLSASQRRAVDAILRSSTV